MSHRFLALLALALWLPRLSAQQLPSQPQPSVVRVTTRLVEVSVTAVDSHGSPLSGLSRDDLIWLGSFPITAGMTSTPQLANFSKDSQIF